MIAAVIALIVSAIIMIHHRIKHGYWIDKQDINNHETVALFILGIAIGILIGGDIN